MSLLRSIPKKIIIACTPVYFRLCIDLMHILPPVTAEGFDGSHHPRFAECVLIESISRVMLEPMLKHKEWSNKPCTSFAKDINNKEDVLTN